MTGPSDAPGQAFAIDALKARLDAIRPASLEALANLEKWYDIELTYTSNAIEGGTLTRSETAIVIEKGITIGGKSLVDHIEAVDHYQALGIAREIARQGRQVTEADVLRLHELVLHRSKPGIAGHYAETARRIAGSGVILPAPAKIPGLMTIFGRSLETRRGWVGAVEAHYELVSIHPFADGNGRTARLLMNLLLLRDGYPPISIAPEHRADYLAVLERRQIAEPLGHGMTDQAASQAYVDFMGLRLVASLEDHLAFLGHA